MRIYIGVFLAMMVVLGFGFFNIGFLEKDAKEILNALEGLDKIMEHDSWHQAQQEASQAEKIWSKHKDRWAMVMDHREIDNIDMTLAKMVRYIGLENYDLAAGELAVLRQRLQHIPEKEQVCISNIF